MTNERLIRLLVEVSMEIADKATVDYVPRGVLLKAERVRNEIRRRQAGLIAAELESERALDSVARADDAKAERGAGRAPEQD